MAAPEQPLLRLQPAADLLLTPGVVLVLLASTTDLQQLRPLFTAPK